MRVEEAIKAKQLIDDTGCGGMGHRKHEDLQLELPT